MSGAKLCGLSVLIILVGCATQPHKVANDGPDLQCHSEETIGSMIPKSVCTTAAQRADKQHQLNELRDAVDAKGGGDTRPAANTAL
jgi:hypothetical protein